MVSSAVHQLIYGVWYTSLKFDSVAWTSISSKPFIDIQWWRLKILPFHHRSVLFAPLPCPSTRAPPIMLPIVDLLAPLLLFLALGLQIGKEMQTLPLLGSGLQIKKVATLRGWAVWVFEGTVVGDGWGKGTTEVKWRHGWCDGSQGGNDDGW